MTTANQVLELLNGWEIQDKPPIDPEDDDGSVIKLTAKEVESFIQKAKIRTAGYINLQDTKDLPENEIIHEAIATWAAGLLWNKYVQKVNEGREEEDPFSYGDKKIWEAKNMLKTYNSDDEGDDELILVSTYTEL